MTSNENLFARFREHWPTDLSKPLLHIPDGSSFSYAEADRRASQIANYLKDLGLTKGDRLTSLVEKSPAALFLYLGCLKAGVTYHPMNTGYNKSEIAHMLADASPTLIVCDPQLEPVIELAVSGINVPKILTLDKEGAGGLTKNTRAYPDNTSIAHCKADDIAALLYSSGTTGKPKGIMLTHKNLSSNATALSKAWGFTPKDILLHALPIYHVHGLFIALGPVLMTGSTILWLEKFNTQSVIQSLRNCSVMMGVPTYYTRLLDSGLVDFDQLRSMRLFISGSAPLRRETFQEFKTRSGHTILERYGMTETGINTSNPLLGRRQAGTVGQALPGVTVRVVDENGKILMPGETGNLQVKGENVFAGYWNMSEKTSEDFTSDGFFNTGDIANIDEQGYVSIVGRSKDMIISGGLNIYPREIELVIDEIPEIIESAVIGIPDHDFGEIVIAVVVAETKNIKAVDIVNQCKSKLAKFKSPKYVSFVEELPRNAMGKVQKNLLRKQIGSDQTDKST